MQAILVLNNDQMGQGDRELEHRGVDLIPCGTCVQAYGIAVQAGTISDMDTILQEMNTAQKVITL